MSRKNIERAQAAYGADYQLDKATAAQRAFLASLETDSPVKDDVRPTVQTRDKDGQPLFTDRQLDEARKLATGRNAHLGRTQAALEQLAMTVTLSKKERTALGLRPVLARGEHLQVEANPAAVERFVEAANPSSPQDLVAKVAQAYGIAELGGIARMGARVGRFIAGQGDKRMPRHIRDKAITLSAMANGVRIAFPAAYAAGAGMEATAA